MNQWRDKDFVAKHIASHPETLYACGNESVSEERQNGMNYHKRMVCLRLLELQEDGLLHCPEHGVEIFKVMGLNRREE